MKRMQSVCLLSLLSLLATTACSLTPSASLQERYRAAVADAAEVRPEEVVRTLKAVIATEAGLRWQAKPGESAVLAVTWTQWTGYDSLEGQPMTLERPVWVTLVPELQGFCQAYDPGRSRPLELRLEQLLGLPSDNGKTRFAELWVRPGDLQRPCPDPEVTDHECGLVFPHGGTALTVSEEYRHWFEDLRDSSYGDPGYPWTRLGYTYDWGGRRSEVGLSEFVIPTGVTVEVGKVRLTADYCR